MIKISKKHKNQLIGGLIIILLSTIGLIIKNYLTKTPIKKELAKNSIEQKIENTNNDSSKQTINQVQQSVSNNGNINNEFVSGDKKNETKIVNNGFINQGGENNTYNQKLITTPPQRHPTLNDIKEIENKIDKNRFPVAIGYVDKESRIFAIELSKKLEQKGFTISYFSNVMLFSSDTSNKNKRFTIDLHIPDTSYMVTIVGQNK
jgi:hypothetical protein